MSYYRGSKVGSYTPPPPPGESPQTETNILISPTIDGKVPILLSIVPGTVQEKNLFAPIKCYQPIKTTGFTVYIPNFQTNATFCAILLPSQGSNTDNVTIDYASTFFSSKDNLYFLIDVGQEFTVNSKYQATHYINLSNYQNDIQSILSSLKTTYLNLN